MKFDHVVFLDAVEFGAAPGSVVFLDSQQITARYPQISTHKISLDVLGHVRRVEWGHESVAARGSTGIAERRTKPDFPVRKTLDVLLDLLLHRNDKK